MSDPLKTSGSIQGAFGVVGTIPKPISKKYLKKASANQPLVKETKHHVVLTFSPTTCVYAAHHHKCSQVNSSKVNAIGEKFPDTKAARKWADVDESEKAGEPTKAFFRVCKCAKTMKEDAAVGFADASAPSNSNYQAELSPTTIAKPSNKGKKKMKTVKERYERNMVELAKVCPDCNNTGVMKKYGNNVLCTSCGGDPRSANSKIIGQQAKDMLSTGKTKAVEEGWNKKIGKPMGHKSELSKNAKENRKKASEMIKKSAEKVRGETDAEFKVNYKKSMGEEVISDLEQIYPVLEAYKASPKLLSRTKYLVHPKLSKKLRDRLAARKPTSKGYTPSTGTLGLAAARRAQMSHSKEKSPKGYPEEVKSLAHSDVADKMAHKKVPVKEVYKKNDLGIPKKPPVKESFDGTKVTIFKPGHRFHGREAHVFHKFDDGRINAQIRGFKKGDVTNLTLHSGEFKDKLKETVGSGNFSTLTRDLPLKNETKKKSNYSARVQSKMLASLSAKPMMGSSNDNRVSEDFLADASNPELKKFTGSSKSGSVKRKYLGAARGRTATGQPAHPIEIDPTIKTNTEVNKVVK
jgi:hypothetical protein